MKNQALFVVLWKKNFHVLVEYAKQFQGATFLLLRRYSSPELVSELQSLDCEVVIVEDAVGAFDHEQEVQRFFSQASALPDKAAWQDFCRGLSMDPKGVAFSVDYALRSQLREMLPILSSLDKLAAQYDIRLAVVNEDVSWIGKTIAGWADRHNVPSLLVAHGTLLGKAYTVHDRLNTDRAAIFSPRAAESYLDAGVSAERLTVTGNPAWDHYPQLVEEKARIRGLVTNKYALNGKPLIFFGTTWGGRFSASSNTNNFLESLEQFLSAVSQLQARSLDFEAIIKDRQENEKRGRSVFFQLAAKYGIDVDRVQYTTEDTEALVVASDVVVSMDSNLSVEAMMAGVPAVNMLNEAGLRIGPSFDASSGILEVPPEQLAEAIYRLLSDQGYREHILSSLSASLPRYALSMDGGAGRRVAQLMHEMAVQGRPKPVLEKKYIWQTFLDIDDLALEGYHNVVRKELVEDMFVRPPRVLLEIGCGEGLTGKFIKMNFPEAKVIGFEPNRRAGELASRELDKVFVELFDVKHLDAAGIGYGSIDTVIVADVLEHMYNPWQALADLEPYLSTDAHVIASIPNIRNLLVMEDLAKGHWHYDTHGLLDITHIRFFTKAEVLSFFKETGYEVLELRHAIDPRLADFFQQKKQDKPFNLELEKLVLKDVTPEEFAELCSLQFYLRVTPRRGLGAGQEIAGSVPYEDTYGYWLGSRRLSDVEGRQFELRMAQWAAKPLFHVVVYGDDYSESQLILTLSSLGRQLYDNLCVTVFSPADCPSGLEQGEKFSWRKSAEPFAKTLNELLREGKGDWFLFLHAGDGVESHLTLLAVEAINNHPEWTLIYTDEDELSEDGEPVHPIFKPDWNQALLQSMPYMGDMLMVRADRLRDLGGLRNLPGGEFYDLALRVGRAGNPANAIGHLAYLLCHRRHGATTPERMVAKHDACMQALQSYVRDGALAAEVESGAVPLTFRLRRNALDEPSVSILIAARGHLQELQHSLEAVIESTQYGNYEILVADCGGDDPDYQAYIRGLEALGNAGLRIFSIDGRVSLQTAHNALAGMSRGNWLVFLHFDAVPLEPGWLADLVRLAGEDDIGAVSPRLLGKDGMVRAGGQILGFGGVGDSPFAGMKIDDPGYAGRGLVEQDFSALPGGCLMVRTAAFAQVGGFDSDLEDDMVATADFGLRLKRQGWRLVWTPHVNVMSPGISISLGWREDCSDELARQLRKKAAMARVYEKELPDLARDPAYNPNFSLREPFVTEARRELNWNILDWRPLPRIVAHYADNTGCGHYRMIAPARALTKAGLAQAWSNCQFFSNAELARLAADTIVFQRPIMAEHKEILKRYEQFSKAFLVYDADDLFTNLPVKSAHHKDFTPDLLENFRRGVAMCDRFVVSTEFLKETFRDMHDEIVVVPNCIDWDLWKDLTPQRGVGTKPRVGWVGAIGHTGDLEILLDVVKELANEVEWVFMGMCLEEFRPYIKQIEAGVPFLQYPARMASLNLDLALAPLDYHPFNEAKSHLRLLEYGALGIPVICTDILPYQGDYPVRRVKNTTKAWVDAIRDYLYNPNEMPRQGDLLKQYVKKNWLLQDNAELWLKAWSR